MIRQKNINKYRVTALLEQYPKIIKIQNAEHTYIFRLDWRDTLTDSIMPNHHRNLYKKSQDRNFIYQTIIGYHIIIIQ